MIQRLAVGRVPDDCPYSGKCDSENGLAGCIGLCSATAWLLTAVTLDTLPTSSGVPA
jgi:hypothetical protein